VWLRTPAADLAEKFPFLDILQISFKQSKKLFFCATNKIGHLLLQVRNAFVATNFRLSTSDFTFLFSRLALRPA